MWLHAEYPFPGRVLEPNFSSLRPQAALTTAAVGTAAIEAEARARPFAGVRGSGS